MKSFPGIESLYVQTIDFQVERRGILNIQNTSPLGVIGESLTRLQFGEVMTQNEPDESTLMNSQTMATTSRWVFFNSIASLPNVRELCLPHSSWTELTKCGLGVVAPLCTKEGLKITDLQDGVELAKIEDRRFVKVAR